MASCVIDLLEDYSRLAKETGRIECECHIDKTCSEKSCEFLLSCYLLPIRIEHRLSRRLVHQDSLCDILLASCQALVSDPVVESDLLGRKDVLLLSCYRCSRSDLRHIVRDRLKIDEAGLGLLIHREVESLESVSLVVFTRHLLEDI